MEACCWKLHALSTRDIPASGGGRNRMRPEAEVTLAAATTRVGGNLRLQESLDLRPLRRVILTQWQQINQKC